MQHPTIAAITPFQAHDVDEALDSANSLLPDRSDPLREKARDVIAAFILFASYAVDSGRDAVGWLRYAGTYPVRLTEMYGALPIATPQANQFIRKTLLDLLVSPAQVVERTFEEIQTELKLQSAAA